MFACECAGLQVCYVWRSTNLPPLLVLLITKAVYIIIHSRCMHNGSMDHLCLH